MGGPAQVLSLQPPKVCPLPIILLTVGHTSLSFICSGKRGHAPAPVLSLLGVPELPPNAPSLAWLRAEGACSQQQEEAQARLLADLQAELLAKVELIDRLHQRMEQLEAQGFGQAVPSQLHNAMDLADPPYIVHYYHSHYSQFKDYAQLLSFFIIIISIIVSIIIYFCVP